jgi:hypothetical protein
MEKEINPSRKLKNRLLFHKETQVKKTVLPVPAAVWRPLLSFWSAQRTASQTAPPEPKTEPLYPVKNRINSMQ